MNRKIEKLLSASLTLMLILSFATVFRGSAAPEKQKIYVDPPTREIPPEMINFTIGICVGDWSDPPLWGYEFRLGYDNTLLEAVEAWLPEGHFLTPEDPTKIYVVDPGTIKHDEGYVSFALTLMAPEPGHTGSGVLANITFTQTPPPLRECTTLDLDEVVLVGFVEGAFEIPPEDYDIGDGDYCFGPPPPPVHLKVEPSIVGAYQEDQPVTVHVTINDVTADLGLFGVEFKLRYDTTLLKPRVPCVTDLGEFFEPFAPVPPHAEPGVKCDFWVEEDYVLVWCLILPTDEGEWPPPYAEGDGRLATIHFSAASMPETLTESVLLLDDVILLGLPLPSIRIPPPPKEIPPHHLEHGTYKAPVMREDLNFDGVINIADMSIFGAAYGSYPGHPRWDAIADINYDDKVNILDGVKVAAKFGIIYYTNIVIKVEPPESGGSEFTVDIEIQNVKSKYHLIAIQFKLRYNTTLLETKEEWVTQGPFFEGYAPYGKFFEVVIENDYVLVGILVYSNPDTGKWGPPYAEGDGALATITFNATAPGECPLELDEAWATLVTSLRGPVEIPIYALEDGHWTGP